MSERIEKIVYKTDVPGTILFFDGPTEFLVAAVADEIAAVSQWSEIFNGFIDPYRRMDYQMRNLPALRIYNEEFRKDFESWFIEGEIKADIIWPASIRRKELQQLPDSISAALLQQFRRPSFFDAVAAKTPGLNELGKIFSTDKSLGFAFPDSEEPVPLTQITFNFRLDLRQWDLYLEQNLRTKDDPFEETLGNLKRVVTTIQALRDSGDKELEVPLDQKITT